MKRTISAVIAALFFSGLVYAAQAKVGSKTRKKSAAAIACKKEGGKLRKVGMMGDLKCIVPYPDAGRDCTDSQQCQGGCFAVFEGVKGLPKSGTSAIGKCKADNNPFGCYTRVDRGRVGDSVCID